MMPSPHVIDQKTKWIADRLMQAGASAVYKVGGCVRDAVMSRPSSDIDMEVYGLTYETILSTLADTGLSLDLVGRQFAIVRVDTEIDVSIPRRDNKHGVGHKGFDIVADPSMTPVEAAARRDFTMNSVFQSFNGEIFDPFNGVADIRAGVLRATTDAFLEDPLRVLRGMQFASRFGFTMDGRTLDLCMTMRDEYGSLSRERVWHEWRKWALGAHPKHGLDVLLETGWITHFPEISALIACPQDPEWHPEGDVYAHTRFVCDAAALIAGREALESQDHLVLLFAALCHDLGKKITTVPNADGRWIAPGHAQAGVQPTYSFLTSIGAPRTLALKVAPLVAEHMTHLSVRREGVPLSARLVRRLSVRLAPASVKLWMHLVEADHSGRPPIPARNPVEEWMELAEKERVAAEQPKQILMGRHLIEAGYSPGPGIGRLLAAAYEAQLDGAFDTLSDGIRWVEARHCSQT